METLEAEFGSEAGAAVLEAQVLVRPDVDGIYSIPRYIIAQQNSRIEKERVRFPNNNNYNYKKIAENQKENILL